MSDEEVPSEEEEALKGGQRDATTGSLKRPSRHISKSPAGKGSPALASKDRKDQPTKKRRIEQTPSPYRPSPVPPRSAPHRLGAGSFSSPTSSPYSSASSGAPPSKLLLALTSLPNAKRISRLIGVDLGGSFDEWPNRLTSSANINNTPPHLQRQYVLHFVSLWEELLSSLSEEPSSPSRQYFSEDLQVIIKTHYPCDQRTILDQVLATFILFHPEHVSSVLAALIDLLLPPPNPAAPFPPNSPSLSLKGNKRVLSYNKKNLPFSNLLALFTACREEEGGIYYQPDVEEGNAEADQASESYAALVEDLSAIQSMRRQGRLVDSGGWSPALLVCREIVRYLTDKCYVIGGSESSNDMLHPSRKICAWLTDCLIEGPAVLREEHFKSLLARVDRAPEGNLLEKKGAIVLLKELIFQEHNKYRTLILAHNLIPLLLSHHLRFMRTKRLAFPLSLQAETAGSTLLSLATTTTPTRNLNLSPSRVGYLLPFKAVIKAYFSQPSQVLTQHFVYQLIRSPPLQHATPFEESHVIFPLFELLVSIFSHSQLSPRKRLKKKKKMMKGEWEAEEERYQTHAWFANHFLDPILEILGGEDGIGVPQARKLLEKVFFNRSYSWLIFGKDEADEQNARASLEASAALLGEKEAPVKGTTGDINHDAMDVDGKGKEKDFLHRGGRGGRPTTEAVGEGGGDPALVDPEEKERFRLRMVSTLLEVMRNYGKEVQEILMEIWEESWCHDRPSTTEAHPASSATTTTSIESSHDEAPLLSFRAPPMLNLNFLTTPSTPTATPVASATTATHSPPLSLSWERLKALLALYRVAGPELQAMSRRIFKSYLGRLAQQHSKESDARLLTYQRIMQFFVVEGKRGFAELFIDFLSFLVTEEDSGCAEHLASYLSRLFGTLTADALAVRLYDHGALQTPPGAAGGAGRQQQQPQPFSVSGGPLSSLGAFATAYRPEALSTLVKVKQASSSSGPGGGPGSSVAPSPYGYPSPSLKSPFKSRRLSSIGGKVHSHQNPLAVVEVCRDEPSKTKAAALLILDTLKALQHWRVETNKATTPSILGGGGKGKEKEAEEQLEKREAMVMQEDEVVEEVGTGNVASVVVDREFFKKDKVAERETETPASVTGGKEEEGPKKVREYLRRILVSKSFLDYLFRVLAPSPDANSRGLVLQVLLALIKGTTRNDTVESMDIEEGSGHVDSLWSEKRNVKVLSDLLGDAYPQIADNAEEYLRILLSEGKKGSPDKLPRFVELLLEELWVRVAGCVAYEDKGKRLVSALSRIAYHWSQQREVKARMVERIESLLFVRERSGERVWLSSEVRPHCWPNPCLLALLRELNNNHNKEEEEAGGASVVTARALSQAMTGLLRNEKDVQVKQYELLASCLHNLDTKEEAKKEEGEDDEGGSGLGGQFGFLVSQLPLVIHGLCSPFTEIRDLCFMILRKALEVKPKEKKAKKEEEEEEEEGRMVARIDGADFLRDSVLADYVATLFEERVKMELMMGNPTHLHFLREAQARLM